MDLTGRATLTFSFAGLVVASVLYSLPFVVQPLQSGLVAGPHRDFPQSPSLIGRS